MGVESWGKLLGGSWKKQISKFGSGEIRFNSKGKNLSTVPQTNVYLVIFQAYLPGKFLSTFLDICLLECIGLKLCDTFGVKFLERGGLNRKLAEVLAELSSIPEWRFGMRR